MEWSEVIENEILQNLPFKIELDEWGNVVMSPASNSHSFIQGIIIEILLQLKKGGRVFPECSVATSKGVKVADVAWLSSAFIAKNKLETPYRAAPELCVEVVSPSNSRAEMQQKRDLYFAKGAQEVWLCSEERVTFFNHYGEVASSDLFPDFPSVLELDLPDV